jgi:putative two-component system response regulator
MENYKILAVDDEPFNLDLIEFAFDDEPSLSIFRATSGQEAIEKLMAEEYDVLLLDISMPVMDGLSVLRVLREDKKFQHLPILMVTANPEKKHEALTIGATDFLAKPVDIIELKLRTLNYAKAKKNVDIIEQNNAILEERVRERTAQLQDALTLSKATEREISERLGKASEYRDLETGMHIKRMSHYSAHLAKLANLSEEDQETILYASPLHDIGKVGIPDEILLKPGRFEKNEFEIMKLHAEIGAKMLEDGIQFSLIEAGYHIALDHHERYDGTGYPNEKSGDDIHLFARIVSIADVFDALSSERVYKKAFSIDKTVEIMKSERAKAFDPKLLDLFLDNLDNFLEIKKKFVDPDEKPSILKLMEKVR